MLVLRKILLSKWLYIFFVTFTVFLTVLRLFMFPDKSSLKGDEKELEGVITKYQEEGNQLTLTIAYCREFVLGYYYFEQKKDMDEMLPYIALGRKIKVRGELVVPEKNTTKNVFSYRDYLKHQRIYYLMNIKELSLFSSFARGFQIKNAILKRIASQKLVAPYVKTFLLGDDSDLKKEVKESFQKNGISHLFAISGMHISLLSCLFLFLLEKLSLKEKSRYFLVGLFLLFYLSLTFSPSVLRATLFFLFFSLNKIYYFYIKPIYLFLVVLSLSLLLDPYFIYSLGFQYSFLISFSLIVSSPFINKKNNYFSKLLKTSLISFLAGSFISLRKFYEINFFSIFYNLFFVPFISFIVFPLSLLVFLFPILEPLCSFFLVLLEKISILCAHISMGRIIFGKPSVLFQCLFLLVFFGHLFLLSCGKKGKSYLFVFLYGMLYVKSFFFFDHQIILFDIGQGDAILIRSKNKTMLVDTGGKLFFYQRDFEYPKKTTKMEQVILPYLKSQGIRKLDYLVLTHGDYDHLGEANILLENMPVSHIYINDNEKNDLEEELSFQYSVKKLRKDQVISLGDIFLYSINGGFQEENDDSIVLYGKYKNRTFLLMGDASCKSEERILKNYQIGPIDLLKVGHHGSTTSSCDTFLSAIKPKVAVISSGRNNKFHHPHSEVIERFQKRGIQYFVTKDQGSIYIDLQKFSVKYEGV